MKQTQQAELLPPDREPVTDSLPTHQPRSALMILDAVTQRGADVATIEAIAKLYREERDDERRMACDAAMSQAQSEMRSVSPDASNSQTHSRYATYAALDRKIRPIYTAHGFGLSFNTVPGAVGDMVKITCRVSHKGGWGADYAIDIPADGKGAKGGDVMTKTHAVGSATSYGMRYLLRLIFNIAVGEDDDGNAASGTVKAISEDQARNLRELCEASGSKLETVLAMAGVSSMDQYPVAAYDKAAPMLKQRADKGGGAR